MADSTKSEERPKASWDSPKLSQIGHRWREQNLARDIPVKDVMGIRLDQLARLVKSELSKDELAELASSCSTMPKRDEDRNEFASYLLRAVVFVCVETGDRDALVRVLAARYPSDLCMHCDTEDFLVGVGGVDQLLTLIEVKCGKPKGPHFRNDLERAMTEGFKRDRVVGTEDADLLERAVKWCNDPKNREEYRLGGKFTDPILILTDAYSRSKDQSVRHDIAVAIRHSFAGLGVTGKDDAAFVENAVKWYRKNRDRLEPNPNYCHNSIAPGFFEYETNPLFVARSPVERNQ